VEALRSASRKAATRAGVVNADAFWERITYFLDDHPVANEYRSAWLPSAGSGVPPEGYQGVNRVLGTIDELKKFVSIRENPYHGLNFCQGPSRKISKIQALKSSTSSAGLARAKNLQRALPQHSRTPQRLEEVFPMRATSIL